MQPGSSRSDSTASSGSGSGEGHGRSSSASTRSSSETTLPSGLSEQSRKILLMRYTFDYSYEEIAVACGQPAGSKGRKWARARMAEAHAEIKELTDGD